MNKNKLKEKLSERIHELSYKHENEIMLAHDDLIELATQAKQEVLEEITDYDRDGNLYIHTHVIEKLLEIIKNKS